MVVAMGVTQTSTLGSVPSVTRSGSGTSPTKTALHASATATAWMTKAV